MDGWGWLGSALRDGFFCDVWLLRVLLLRVQIFSWRSGALHRSSPLSVPVHLGLHVAAG
jgi:hypothetical protein